MTMNGRGPDLVDLVQRADVRMVQRRRVPRLPQQPLRGLVRIDAVRSLIATSRSRRVSRAR